MRRAVAAVWLTGCAFHEPTASEVAFVRLPDLPAGEHTRLALVGDAGTRGTHGCDPRPPDARSVPGCRPLAVADAAVAACGPECDAVVWLGDNLYPSGVGRGRAGDRARAVLTDHAARWQVDGHPLPIVLVLGNHDHGPIVPSAARAARELAWAEASPQVITGDAPFFVVRIGALDVVGVDSDWFVRGPGRHGGADALWHGLAELRAPGAPYTAVVAHHPIRSYGDHGDAGQFRHSGLGTFRGAAWAQVRADGVISKVDAWLAGHDHLLEALPGQQAYVVGAGSKVSWVRGPVAGGDEAYDSLGFGILDVDPDGVGITVALRFLSPEAR